MTRQEIVFGPKDALDLLNPADKVKLLVASLIQILLSFVDLFGVALIGVMVSLANGGEGAEPPTYVTTLLQRLNLEEISFDMQVILIGCVAAFILGFKSLLTVYVLRRNTLFLGRRSAEISKVLTSKLLSGSLTELQVTSIQRSLFAITQGVLSIVLGVIARGLGVVGDLAILITIFIGLLVLNPSIALASLIIFGSLGPLLYLLIRKRASYAGKLSSVLNVQSNQEIYEVLDSFREVYVKNRGHFYAEKIGASRLSLSRNQARISLYYVYSKYILDTSVTVGALLVAMFQLYFVGGAEAVSSLGLFLAAGLRLAPSVLRLQNNLIEIKIALSFGQETLLLHKRLKDAPSSLQSVQDESTDYRGFEGTVEFENVNFTYRYSSLPAIRDVTFFLPKGIFCGIVGASGAGKSTLVDILLGVLKPDTGKVLLSGLTPPQAISTWPGAVGYVPQDVAVIQGTIRENVTLGYPSDFFSEKLLWEVLDISQLGDFIRSQPRGLDTPVGDKGAKLSGGQKQRLGIARALLSKPQIIILDEATSALDSETEKEFVRALLSLRGKVTLVVIAHRLSTIESASIILEVDEGTVKYKT